MEGHGHGDGNGTPPVSETDWRLRSYPCAHCQVKPASRPRRLCWTCYYTPGVKEQYPPFNRKTGETFKGSVGEGGNGVYTQPSKLPDDPTDEAPGTDEKVRVMAERARRRECLFHPADKQRNRE